jgi:hypothetical protein
MARGWHIRLRSSPSGGIRRFENPQVSRPIPADVVHPNPADSVSQAENASSTLVTRSTYRHISQINDRAVSSLSIMGSF